MQTKETELPIIAEIELTPLRSMGELVGVNEPETVPEAPKPFYRRYALELITLALPLAIAALYLFIVASDRYVSEARFIVRSSSSTGAASMAAMLENQGLSRATDDTFAINEYIGSRDVVALLAQNDGLREILNRPEGDFINRYPNFYSRNNQEYLFRRYNAMVSADIDPTTNISTLTVQTFRAEDSQKLAEAILQYAEQLVNRLNDRAYNDAVRYSQSMVDRAQNEIADIQKRLALFRNSSGSVDPGKEVTAAFEMIGKMTTELVLLEATAAEQIAISPSSPAVRPMREKITAYKNEIDKLRLRVVGDQSSLASKLADFEKLMLERQFAAGQLAVAIGNLVKARQDAQQQHLYLQRIVEPNVADEAKYPRRLLDIAIVLALSLAVYSILRSLWSITLDHQA
jgi:capsular polysaccharide transport system permease protein